jgi:hypothetical protein
MEVRAKVTAATYVINFVCPDPKTLLSTNNSETTCSDQRALMKVSSSAASWTVGVGVALGMFFKRQYDIWLLPTPVLRCPVQSFGSAP